MLFPGFVLPGSSSAVSSVESTDGTVGPTVRSRHPVADTPAKPIRTAHAARKCVALSLALNLALSLMYASVLLLGIASVAGS